MASAALPFFFPAIEVDGGWYGDGGSFVSAAAAWAENGPPWIAVRLSSVDAVRAVRPGYLDLDVGLVALLIMSTVIVKLTNAKYAKHEGAAESTR